MSFRARLMPLFMTLGAGAAAAAAQLGVAYGFTILLWAKDFQDQSGASWAANLTWVCWLAGTSVVLGAIVGNRVTRAAGLPASPLTQAAIAGAAGAGALVIVPLVAIPASYADFVKDSSPGLTVTRMAVVGVLLGAVVAFGVLLGRPLAWNVVVHTGWLWLVALGSALFALRGDQNPHSTQLALWGVGQPSWLSTLLPMLLTALLIGAGLAYLGKQLECSRVSVAISGAVGPLLVGVAYLAAGPGSRPELGGQFLPYLAAPYAVIAGLLGSLLVAAIERPEPVAPAVGAVRQSAGDDGKPGVPEQPGVPEKPGDSEKPDGSSRLGAPPTAVKPKAADEPKAAYSIGRHASAGKSPAARLTSRTTRLASGESRGKTKDETQVSIGLKRGFQGDDATQFLTPVTPSSEPVVDAGPKPAELMGPFNTPGQPAEPKSAPAESNSLVEPKPPAESAEPAESMAKPVTPQLRPQEHEEHEEWADQERWLEQIKTDAPPRRPAPSRRAGRPSPGPAPQSSKPGTSSPESGGPPSPQPDKWLSPEPVLPALSPEPGKPRRRWTLFDDED